MVEALKAESPHRFSFEGEIFPILDVGNEWSIGEANWDKILEINELNFRDEKTLVFTERPEIDLEIVEMCLEDHFVLYDFIETGAMQKPAKKLPEVFHFGIVITDEEAV